MIINEKIEEKIEIFNSKDIDDKMLFINGFDFSNVKYITLDKIDRVMILNIDHWTRAATIPFEFINSMRMTIWNYGLKRDVILKDVLISY